MPSSTQAAPPLVDGAPGRAGGATGRRLNGGAGPLLVSLGAAGWGAESLFRSRLDRLGLGAFPIVFVEHVVQVLLTLPLLIANWRLLARVPRRALGYVFLSGAVGSALGTVCYTAALDRTNPTVAAMLLNLQPVVSTVAGALLFSERIRPRFYAWAALAVASGVAICMPAATELSQIDLARSMNGGLALVFGTVLCWGFATAAGRGAMREMPLGLGVPLRLWAGLLTTSLVVAGRALGGSHEFSASAFLGGAALRNLLLLTTLTGALPLGVYFAGLARTPASLAGYCEMFYTVSAMFVGWLFLGGTLLPHQAIFAGVLIVAIVGLNRLGAADEARPVPEAHAGAA